ncbi:MAG: Gfo/Idh/MocA family oxidoreductase [Candidatus Sumerlaeaceae bacterium]|nr:Gfo/Idh/MocA family oxidoreductase [Candidatus Sumerlaeaceae bacterium]
MEPLRIAIISFEHMHAYSYARVLDRAPWASLVAVAEADAGRLKAAMGDLKSAPQAFDDYRKMLDSVSLDAVVITTANADHAPVAIECAQRGKHILCEKPIATTVADACAMIRAAGRSRVRFMTAFPVRFSPAVHRAREAVLAGDLGRVLGACTSNHGSMPGGWFTDIARAGGGAVMDHTVHVTDLLRWILDDEVAEVSAEYGTRLHALACDDVGQLLLRFCKGTVASLDTSWSRPRCFPIWGDVKIELKGERANASLNCFPRAIHYYDDASMRHTAEAPGVNLDELMLAEFVAAVREDRPPAVTGVDGLRALEVTLAAYESGRIGEPVTICPATA